MKRKLTGIFVALACFLGLAFSIARIDNKIHIARSINVFAELLRTLDELYVDSLDISKMSKTAFSAMLKEVDPYTEYYSEEELQRADLITKGEYAGIGALLYERDGKIIVRKIYEGSPSDKAGLEVADEILALDGNAVNGWGMKKVLDYLKGQPGQSISLTFIRPGQKEPVEKTFDRELIKLPIIPYYGMRTNKTGYICLSSFSSGNTASEFKAALEELLQEKAESLIIDLRNNGGGRMEEAIKICSYFLPRNSLVLTMKGKKPEYCQSYSTMSDPIVPASMPVAVLVNRGTASASEILSGALQDYDRAVIVGERSFGKGLVQTLVDMPYRGKLKYTNAKYYIPSGRCVQAITYNHSDSQLKTSTVPDSLLKPFKTMSGRIVYEGSGIMPDKEVKSKIVVPESFTEMEKKDMFFDFVTRYKVEHGSIATADEFKVTDAMIRAFTAYLKFRNFSCENKSQKALEDLMAQARKDGVYSKNKAYFTQLEAGLKVNLDSEINKNIKLLKNRLSYEFLSRYYDSYTVLKYQLDDDICLNQAIEAIASSVGPLQAK